MDNILFFLTSVNPNMLRNPTSDLPFHLLLPPHLIPKQLSKTS